MNKKLTYERKALVELYNFIQEWRAKHSGCELFVQEITVVQSIVIRKCISNLQELEESILVAEAVLKEE